MARTDEDPERIVNGKYRILSRLDEGAMGVVYRAEQLDAEGRPQREVALKTIKEVGVQAEAAEYVKRFLREVQVMMRVRSSHVVTVYDSGRDEAGQLYYVMELMQGQTLKQMLQQQRPLSVERAVSIAEQICKGLAEAHGLSEPVIHRDLKPANIFIEQELSQDWVKIADFGIAKILNEQGAELTGIVGTPKYMAPEQWTGEPVDARTDLYALGVILYETLSGQAPFRAAGGVPLEGKHRFEPPPPLPGTIPAALCSLVMQLLAKSPADRPRDAATVRHALIESIRQKNEEESADTEILTAPTERLPQPSGPRVRSVSPKRWQIGALIAVLLLGGGVWWKGVLKDLLFPHDTAAVRHYLQAAQKGDRIAQFNLAMLYAGGQGVEQNLTEAVYWYRKAAEQGSAAAQNNLGNLYAQGQGVPQDFTEAGRWYRKAAEQGSGEAQTNLGLLYAQGRGVPQDIAEATRWYRKAAEQGSADAQYNLGALYEEGGQTGKPPNSVEAVGWYRKAAEQGHTPAQAKLGSLYAQGKGVAQDMTEAARWYRKAAEQGNADAREQLQKILGMDPSGFRGSR